MKNNYITLRVTETQKDYLQTTCYCSCSMEKPYQTVSSYIRELIDEDMRQAVSRGTQGGKSK